jgi:ferritin
MRASEIITDDIISKEKRKPSGDVVGKRTSSDYFGNRKEIKKTDRDLLSKEQAKEKQKQWFEDEELGEAADYVYNSVKDAYRAAQKQNKKVVRSIGGYFKLADKDAPGPQFIPDTEFLKKQTDIGNKIRKNTSELQQLFYKLRDAVGSDEKKQLLQQQISLRKQSRELNADLRELRKTGSSYKQIDEADPCWKNYKQVGMKQKGGKRVPNCVPRENVTKEEADKYSERVEEETMKGAAKNPGGARFGGYYGATQRGAPRRGQGFGT